MARDGLALAPWPVLAVALSDRAGGLTTVARRSTSRSRTVTRSSWPLALRRRSVAATAAAARARRATRADPSPRAHRSSPRCSPAVLVAGAAYVWVEEGSPVTLADRAWYSFSAPPQGHGAPDVTARLSSCRRTAGVDLWRRPGTRFRGQARCWATAPARSGRCGRAIPTRVAHEPGGSQPVRPRRSATWGCPGSFLLVVALAAPFAAAVAQAPASARARRARRVRGASSPTRASTGTGSSRGWRSRPAAASRSVRVEEPATRRSRRGYGRRGSPPRASPHRVAASRSSASIGRPLGCSRRSPRRFVDRRPNASSPWSGGPTGVPPAELRGPPSPSASRGRVGRGRPPRPRSRRLPAEAIAQGQADELGALARVADATYRQPASRRARAEAQRLNPVGCPLIAR